jgi:hypothetical protein
MRTKTVWTIALDQGRIVSNCMRVTEHNPYFAPSAAISGGNSTLAQTAYSAASRLSPHFIESVGKEMIETLDPNE